MSQIITHVEDFNFYRYLTEQQQASLVCEDVDPKGPFTLNDFNLRTVANMLTRYESELKFQIGAIIYSKFEKLHFRKTISRAGWEKINAHLVEHHQELQKKMNRFFMLFWMGAVNTDQLPVPAQPTLTLKPSDTRGVPLTHPERLVYQREAVDRHNEPITGYNKQRTNDRLLLACVQSIHQLIPSVGDLEAQFHFVLLCKLNGLFDKDFQITISESLEEAQKIKEKFELLKEQFLASVNPPSKKKKKKKKKAKPEDAPSAAAPSAAPTIATPVATVDNQAAERAARVIRLNQFQNQDGCREDDRAKRWHIPKSQIHRVEGFRDTDRNGNECFKYRYPHAKKTEELLSAHHQFLIQQLRNHDFKIHLVFNEPKEFVETYFHPRDWTNAKGVKQPGWIAFARQRTREGVMKGVLEVAIDENNKLYHRVFVPMDKLDFRLLSLPLQKQLLADEEVKENGGPQQELEHEGHHAVDITPDDETLILTRGQLSDDDWVIHEIPKRKI